MKRLYITHKPGEWALAWFPGSTAAFLIWLLTTDSAGMPLYMRFVWWQVVLGFVAATFFCLFAMSGSDERRNAAEGKD